MNTEMVARELEAEYDRWWGALPTHDVATLDQILAEDWVYIDQFGAVRNKAEYIALVEAAIRPDHSTVTVSLGVRLLGEVAVATGRYDVHGVIAGNAVDIQLSYTSVWTRDEGRWRCRLQHTTEIREAPW